MAAWLPAEHSDAGIGRGTATLPCTRCGLVHSHPAGDVKLFTEAFRCMHRRRECGEVHAVTTTRTQGAHMSLAIEPDRDGRSGCASLLGGAVGY